MKQEKLTSLKIDFSTEPVYSSSVPGLDDRNDAFSSAMESNGFRVSPTFEKQGNKQESSIVKGFGEVKDTK